jgi:hypothetical protein
MAQLSQLACPVMRRGTRFHAHQTRRQRLEERYHLAAPQLLPDDHLLVRVDAVNLMDVLGEIKPIVPICMWTAPLIVIRLRRSRYGTSMPGAGAVHYINCGPEQMQQGHALESINHLVGTP